MEPLPTETREWRVPKCTGIDALTMAEVPIPIPGPNEVLVKVHAVSLNYRDIMIVSAQYPGGAKDNVIPGSDAACEVVAVPPDEEKWKIGERVMANFCLTFLEGEINPEVIKGCLGSERDGVLTEYRVFPSEVLVRIPDHLTYEQASALPCVGVTAWNALQGPVPVKKGDTVLIQGTGGISILSMQIAHALSATTIITSSSNTKLARAKALGVDYTINYKETPDWELEVLKITEHKGVDHVIEVGGVSTILKSIASTRMGGSIHSIGFVAGFDDGGVKPLQITQNVLGKALNLRGVLIGSLAQFETLIQFIAEKKIVPAIDDTIFKFTEVKEAYAYVASQRHFGKVVVRCS
ncbi:NAD-P-binding protein [Cristinia sonorae]|uniref:NAD-P-binding protein n=1 Tax=Cristinia sonorae TaxID=1940300 RepID=A0A8K0UIK2_9AGAR|nr:NAD-P-binding protein [Cristinia sonorae]